MSYLGTIREVGLEPGYTGSISTKKAVKFGKQERMVHAVKDFKNFEEENSDIPLLVKCLLPLVSAV